MLKQLCLFCCLLLCGPVFCQFPVIGHKTLPFDENGKLLRPPAHNFRTGGRLRFTIKQQGSLPKAVSDYMDQQAEFMHLLNDSTQQEKALVEGLQPFYRFFTNVDGVPGVDALWNLRFNELLCFFPGLDARLRAGLHGVTLNGIVAPCQQDPNCLNQFCRDQLQKASAVAAQLAEIAERRKLWQQLLCDFKRKDTALYQLYEKKAGGFYPEYVLTGPSPMGKEILPGTVALTPRYEVNGKAAATFHARKKHSFYSLTVKSNKAPYVLQGVDIFGQQAIAWANRTNRLLDRQWAKKLQQDCDELVKKYGNMTLHPCGDSCKLEALQAAIKDLSLLDSTWCFSSPIGQYLRSWAWFSNGAFSLRYPDRIPASPDKDDYAENARRLKNIDEKLNKIALLKNCDSCRRRSLVELDWLQQEEKKLNRQKDELTKAQADADDARQQIEKAQVTTQTLHFLRLPMKRKKHRQYVYYFDGGADYDLRSKRDLLPEDRDVYFSVYNSPLPATAISFIHATSDFNDAGPLEKDLAPALGNLISAAASLSGSGTAVSALVGALFTVAGTHGNGVLEGTGHHNIVDNVAAQRQEDCAKASRDLFDRLWRLQQLQSLLQEYLRHPLPAKLDNKVSTDTAYYTFYQRPALKAAPYTDSFTVVQTKTKSKLAEGVFSTGRQKVISIGAGFFYDNSSPKQVTIDTAGNGFGVSSSDTKVKYVIGLKVFPFKAFEADGSVVPRFPLSRVAFFGGVEIIHPLDNLYLGLGYDLVPGLQVSGGVHYAKRNYYQVQNNQVLDKTIHYVTAGPYFGVSIDPTVLASALKFVFQ